MIPKLKGLTTTKKTLANGRVTFYCYAWRGGPLLRSPAGDPLQPTDPTLPVAFARAHERRRNPETNDLSMLIREFRQSSDFRGKSLATRRSYEFYLDLIRSEFGELPFNELEDIKTRGKFKAWRDTIADRPRAADYAWSTLARVLSFAKDRGHINANVAERGGRLYRANRRESIWLDEDIARFDATAPSCLGLALLMALWTGQRQGDLLRAPWSAYDGKTLRIRQSKTGARVIVPVGRPLRLALDGIHGKGGTILTNTHGKAWTNDGFRTSWRKACLQAGITGLTFHDLRGTAVTRLALAGCTAAEIAAITGHSMRDVHSIIDAHYLGGKLDLAKQAMDKLEARYNLP